MATENYCVSCGVMIDPDEPWWAVYAWEAFEGKALEAMPMHEACFTAGEFVEVAEWQNDPETDEPVLVNLGQQRRLLQVPGPGMWTIGGDPTSGAMAPVSVRGAHGA